MAAKIKKSETLHETETNESNPKFIEMQRQMQCLTTVRLTIFQYRKACDTLNNHNYNESTEITEQNSKITFPSPQAPSPCKYRL